MPSRDRRTKISIREPNRRLLISAWTKKAMLPLVRFLKDKEMSTSKDHKVQEDSLI
jgi:hypothetical protein